MVLKEGEKTKMSETKTGFERITAERQRQIDVEGWTPEHDDQWKNRELLRAGRFYEQSAQDLYEGAASTPEKCKILNAAWWPWAPEWCKPSASPIRNLEKAGALFMAEKARYERYRNRPIAVRDCEIHIDECAREIDRMLAEGCGE